MLLTDKYADKIYGTITCYDRMIIQGYIPGWSHAEGMTSYLNAHSIRIFDFQIFHNPLRNKSVPMPNASQIKMVLRLSLSVSSVPSRKMTVSRRSSKRPEKPKGWSTSFLPWNSAIPISHGMIRQVERHFLSSTRVNASIIISTSLIKNSGSAICAFPHGHRSGCSFT